MRIIYHLLPPAKWRLAPPGPFRAASLDDEGFVHCSNHDQVERVANAFFADQPELLVLHIATDRLVAPLRDEDPGLGECFPHVYGSIDRAAIVDVRTLNRAPDGGWEFP